MQTHRYDIDCPKCKYGTLVKKWDYVKKEHFYRCIDCQWVFPVEQIEKPKCDTP